MSVGGVGRDHPHYPSLNCPLLLQPMLYALQQVYVALTAHDAQPSCQVLRLSPATARLGCRSRSHRFGMLQGATGWVAAVPRPRTSAARPRRPRPRLICQPPPFLTRGTPAGMPPLLAAGRVGSAATCRAVRRPSFRPPVRLKSTAPAGMPLMAVVGWVLAVATFTAPHRPSRWAPPRPTAGMPAGIPLPAGQARAVATSTQKAAEVGWCTAAPAAAAA